MASAALSVVWILLHITYFGGPLGLQRNVEVHAFKTETACKAALLDIEREGTKLQRDNPNRNLPIVECIQTLVK